MKRLVSLAATALLLSGCGSFQAFQPATPPDYTGETANVADRIVAVSPQRLHVFEMTQVDGRRLASSSTATTRAGEGGAMTVTPVPLTNELPLRTARVRLQAAVQYASPVLTMQNPHCRTVGDVDFTPVEGRRYAVTGRIGDDACEVWIEDLATKEAVTDKLTGPGTKVQ